LYTFTAKLPALTVTPTTATMPEAQGAAMLTSTTSVVAPHRELVMVSVSSVPAPRVEVELSVRAHVKSESNSSQCDDFSYEHAVAYIGKTTRRFRREVEPHLTTVPV